MQIVYDSYIFVLSINKNTMETTTIAKQRIAQGAKFNGVVYTKFVGKNNVTIFIYLDGDFFKLDHVSKSSYLEVKTTIESELKGDAVKVVSSLVDFHTFCEGQD